MSHTYIIEKPMYTFMTYLSLLLITNKFLIRIKYFFLVEVVISDRPSCKYTTLPLII